MRRGVNLSESKRSTCTFEASSAAYDGEAEAEAEASSISSKRAARETSTSSSPSKSTSSSSLIRGNNRHGAVPFKGLEKVIAGSLVMLCFCWFVTNSSLLIGLQSLSTSHDNFLTKIKNVSHLKNSASAGAGAGNGAGNGDMAELLHSNKVRQKI